MMKTMFLQKNETTSVESVAIQNLTIFPNPVKDILNITAESPINKVEIYNTDGKMMMQNAHFAGEMNVSSLAEGVYMVKIYTAKGVETVKIIKD